MKRLFIPLIILTILAGVVNLVGAGHFIDHTVSSRWQDVIVAPDVDTQSYHIKALQQSLDQYEAMELRFGILIGVPHLQDLQQTQQFLRAAKDYADSHAGQPEAARAISQQFAAHRPASVGVWNAQQRNNGRMTLYVLLALTVIIGLMRLFSRAED